MLRTESDCISGPPSRVVAPISFWPGHGGSRSAEKPNIVVEDQGACGGRCRFLAVLRTGPPDGRSYTSRRSAIGINPEPPQVFGICSRKRTWPRLFWGGVFDSKLNGRCCLDPTRPVGGFSLRKSRVLLPLRKKWVGARAVFCTNQGAARAVSGCRHQQFLRIIRGTKPV